MGLFAAVFQIGTMLEVSEEDAKLFMEEFEKLIEDIDAIGIFLHNTTLSLPMFIPGFGMAWGLFSAGSTGYAFAAITTLAPELKEIPPLAILFLSPFGLMEICAYSLATSRSFILIRAIIKKTDLNPFLKPTLIEIGIVVGLLLAGGFLEDYMIKMAQEEGLQMPNL
ncbi:MAG: stage II sporulation protein M [Nitrosopumilus sp.]|nr:stage II sporulation protein M [Nitrosopumilus sp.]